MLKAAYPHFVVFGLNTGAIVACVKRGNVPGGIVAQRSRETRSPPGHVTEIEREVKKTELVAMMELDRLTDTSRRSEP
jgi:hypothetical protein